MATWRARWKDPETGKPLYRDFTQKQKAETFRDLPRATPVELKRLSEWMERRA